MSLKDSIKNLRMEFLLSQEEFAKKINVSVVTINRWENGKSLPNLSAMKNIRLFCLENKYPFYELEKEWLKSKEIQG